MHSIKPSFLPLLGARTKNDVFRHRTTWAMWSVAVLFAVLAVAFPVQQSASAQEPNGTVTITVNEDSINYETATATITVTDGDTLFDRADVDRDDEDRTENWYVSVRYTIKELTITRNLSKVAPAPTVMISYLENLTQMA